MVQKGKGQKITGVFPMMAMSAVALASFMDSFCNQIIVPNLPFAVKVFFPEISDTDVGYYYGYIISAYSLGGIFGALFWGWYADRFGRKQSFLSCLSCQMILSILFGLVPNYYLAIAVRALWGFTNGNLGVLKTYVSETCSEDKQSLGFSIIVTMGGIANVIGPMLGGFLGDPKTNFPSLIKVFPWIVEKPLFLPCCVGSLLSIVIIIMIIFSLPESLTKEMIKENAIEKKKSEIRYKELKVRMQSNHDYVPSIEDSYVIHLNEGGYLNLIQNHDVLWSCILYGLYGLIQGGQDAIYPIWLTLTPEDNGFDFTSNELGWLYTGLSPNQIISTPILFPLISKLLKPITVSYVTGLIYAILLAFSPWAALVNDKSESIQWIAILISFGLPQCLRFMFVTYPFYEITVNFLTSTNGMVFITNSSYQDFRAKVNGLGQVMSAFGRLIVLGPTLASNAFSWMCQNGTGFPFHFGFPFYMLAVLMLVDTAITTCLPESINYRKSTLREHLQNERDAAEARSVELVELKQKEAISNDEQDCSVIDVGAVQCGREEFK